VQERYGAAGAKQGDKKGGVHEMRGKTQGSKVVKGWWREVLPVLDGAGRGRCSLDLWVKRPTFISASVTAASSPADQPGAALRGVAVLGALLVWLLTILTASPTLHEALHADAGGADHECAITLFSHGTENPVALAVLLVAPVVFVMATLAPVARREIAAAHYWLLPGRAPPVR
jgi:hypothetical protein